MLQICLLFTVVNLEILVTWNWEDFVHITGIETLRLIKVYESHL